MLTTLTLSFFFFRMLADYSWYRLKRKTKVSLNNGSNMATWQHDQSLCMVSHANAVCQSSFFHLCNIDFIRKYLTYDAAKIIIHAFVVSKLDYCNSLLYSLPSYLFRKLQHVQISTARLVNRCPRFLPYYSSPEGSSLAPCLLSY